MYRIVDWVSQEKLEEYQKEYRKLIVNECYISAGDRIKELCKYIKESDFNNYYEDAIIKELIDNKYIICGDTHQYYAIPVFEDGYCLLSMRRWGEIMAAAWELQGFNNKPNFYLSSLCSIANKENLPNGCEIDG